MFKTGVLVVWGVVLASLGLGGCGTVVPNLEDPWRSRDDAPLLVQDLTRSIHCELRNAIVGILNADRAAAAKNNMPRTMSWLDDWGVQSSLQLTIEEKSSLNPNVLLPHSMGDAIRFRNGTRVATAESRTLGFGGSLNSTATRINKLYSFYTIKELEEDPVNCSSLSRDVTRSLLLQDDLRLREWLSSYNLAYNFGDAKINAKPKPPFNENAISHQVKFQVLSSGNVTPSWRLVTISANSSGPFFEARRDRTHDLIITLGPTVADGINSGKRILAATAFNAANNADIASSLSNSVRSSLLP